MEGLHLLKTLLPVLALCAPAGILNAQAAREKPVYTYIAEYGVPRANWEEFSSRWEKQNLPVLERLLADGVIIEFGATANVVHTPGGNTHSFWWSAMSFAGTQRVLDELVKTGTGPAIKDMTHRDRLVRSVVYRARSGRLTSGYSDYNVFYVKPGKSEQWRELYDKNTRPVLEKLFEKGTILGYGVDVEQVHTDKMGARFGSVLYPTAEAVDQTNAAFDALRQKLNADERRAMTAAYMEVYEPDTHRDGMDRIIRWAHK